MHQCIFMLYYNASDCLLNLFLVSESLSLSVSLSQFSFTSISMNGQWPETGWPSYNGWFRLAACVYMLDSGIASRVLWGWWFVRSRVAVQWGWILAGRFQSQELCFLPISSHVRKCVHVCRSSLKSHVFLHKQLLLRLKKRVWACTIRISGAIPPSKLHRCWQGPLSQGTPVLILQRGPLHKLLYVIFFWWRCSFISF